MFKKVSLLLAIMLVASLALAACQPAAPAAEEPEAKFKVCQVTDTGGIDDKSFNATAWKGAEDAVAELGVEAKYLESQEVADYEKNLNAFIEEKCDLIITVGFLLGDATKASAEANPDFKYTIVDVSYDPVIPNVVGQVFQTDEAAFLAGYLAAATTKTGKVGTFGGLPIPPVTIFMDGFARGVLYYNEVKGTNVEVLGWDINDPEGGLFTMSFDDQTKGKEFGIQLMDEGADIIMPVAGPVGLGTAAAITERGNAYIIGVDADWVLTNPDYAPIILTSVLKKMDVTTFNVIKDAMEGNFTGGITAGTIENGGVDLAPFHELDGMVSDELKAELEDVRAKLIDGTITLSDAFKVQ
jgi:basic membrane protein A